LKELAVMIAEPVICGNAAGLFPEKPT